MISWFIAQKATFLSLLSQNKNYVYTHPHTVCVTHVVAVLAEKHYTRLGTCQVLTRMWCLSLASDFRVRRRNSSGRESWLPVRRLYTADIMRSLISLNFHSASILEDNSSDHSHQQCCMPPKLGTWRNLSPSYPFDFGALMTSVSGQCVYRWMDGRSEPAPVGKQHRLAARDWVADGARS